MVAEFELDPGGLLARPAESCRAPHSHQLHAPTPRPSILTRPPHATLIPSSHAIRTLIAPRPPRPFPPRPRIRCAYLRTLQRSPLPVRPPPKTLHPSPPPGK